MTIYLKLMHGRDDPEQQMDDWGFDGPVLGPLEAVHFTYTTHVRCFPKGSNGDAEALELCYRRRVRLMPPCRSPKSRPKIDE
jgi:hypothetical protein